MFFLDEDKDYKTVASGLRRELKALGANTPSHNQVLEATKASDCSSFDNGQTSRGSKRPGNLSRRGR